ncbi:hypothetical protein BMS3Abin01_00313 [bacterium BMS3Abin01]|nr:hypothetical protein BMS3Abin01_00313 [bacterium BMS3Abin01]
MVENRPAATIRPVYDTLWRMDRESEKIARILRRSQVIAVVGASPRPERPSYLVARYLIGQGFRVIPVRPRVSEVLGRRCYPRLEDIPGNVDIVDVFRRPEACPDVARSAAVIGAGALWLQQGIISDEAAEIAAAAGLDVVMDRCIKVAHREMAR